MLMGIIARGTAFVFRHYDAVKDSMQGLYNRIFVWSSFVTPLFLGIIAGATLAGRIDPEATTFSEAYIHPWLNLFSISVGLFTVALCGFLAAVYLVGEADDESDRKSFIRKARNANLLAFLAGFMVFWAAHAEQVPLAKWVFGSHVGLAAVIMATGSLILLWSVLHRTSRLIARALVTFQVTMILLAITYEHYPDVVLFSSGATLSLEVDHAPDATIRALAVALITGSLFILPALAYLYYSFQNKSNESIE
jgi:cytochrome d ubiquinol oxidase subunit II